MCIECSKDLAYLDIAAINILKCKMHNGETVYCTVFSMYVMFHFPTAVSGRVYFRTQALKDIIMSFS